MNKVRHSAAVFANCLFSAVHFCQVSLLYLVCIQLSPKGNYLPRKNGCLDCLSRSSFTHVFTFILSMNLYLPYYVPSHIFSFSLVLRTLTITRTRTSILQLKYFNSSIGMNGDTIAEISVADPSEPSTSINNTLAYRPNITEFHQSGLAGVFLNFEKIFPCASGQFPICRTFTYEEDGFKNGKAIIEAGDSGNHFRIFSSTRDIKTYGFAFQGCSQLNGLNGCMSKYFEMAITCQLPRESCGTLN